MTTTYSSIAITRPSAPAEFDDHASSPPSLSHSRWAPGHNKSAKSDFDAGILKNNSARNSRNYVLNSSFSSHHQSASQPTILEFGSVTESYMAKGRPRGESDLGRSASKPRSVVNGHGIPGVGAQSGDDVLAAVAEVSEISMLSKYINALLIPVPFLLGAFALRHLHPSKASPTISTPLADKATEILADNEPSKASGLLLTATLTSATLLIVGGLGRYRTKSQPGDQRRGSGITSRALISSTSLPSTLRRIIYRILAIALPYLSMIELGGFRISLLLLSLMASGMLGAEPTNAGRRGWKTLIASHKWTSGFFLLSLAFDVTWPMRGVGVDSIVRGYVALIKSTLFLPLPLPTSFPALSKLTAASAKKDPSEVFEASSIYGKGSGFSALSPLIASDEEARLTLLSGGVLGVLTLLTYLSFPLGVEVNSFAILLSLGAALSAAGLLYFSQPSSPRLQLDGGFFAGLALILVFGLAFDSTSVIEAVRFVAFAIASCCVVSFDTKSPLLGTIQTAFSAKDHHHSHHHHPHHHTHDHDHHSPSKSSRFTQFLLRNTADYSLVQSILLEKESRRIVYFMTINLTFMFIQTFYAWASNSLGLLSDSIHMFFDCVGLLAGLIAAIMGKWPPNSRFPYGYGKVETLSGLGNGIFLIFISIEIISESYERYIEGVELKRLEELMFVSVGGLAVNLIGLLFIGHHHHGHDHDHDHGHGHDHSHSNENMMGIYLHILADTMGSVAVILSTLLTYYTGWSGWDPIASSVIAILIIAASIPLVKTSARRLLLTVPSEVEYVIRNTLQEISGLKGVAGYAVPRFWLDDSEASSHDHSHSHNHNHDHGHDHSHESKPKHSHAVCEGKHDHSHIHSHHDHSHSHSHSHTDKHTHSHSDDHDSNHSHADEHSHHDNDQLGESHPPHKHSHTHSHEHEHGHDHHNHHHEHDHSHQQSKKLQGVIHVIARRGHDLEDVRARVEDFLVVRNMDVVVHVEREGLGRCWCGGGVPKHGRHQSTIVMS